jgi:hypothetical protein
MPVLVFPVVVREVDALISHRFEPTHHAVGHDAVGHHGWPFELDVGERLFLVHRHQHSPVIDSAGAFHEIFELGGDGIGDAQVRPALLPRTSRDALGNRFIQRGSRRRPRARPPGYDGSAPCR